MVRDIVEPVFFIPLLILSGVIVVIRYYDKLVAIKEEKSSNV